MKRYICLVSDPLLKKWIQEFLGDRYLVLITDNSVDKGVVFIEIPE